MAEITVVHLARVANGPEALERFLEAYRSVGAGVEHELLIARKGEDSRFPDIGYDIGTYRRAAEQVSTPYVCFLNSWSRPRIEGWLSKLLSVAKRHDVGLVGATGSLEGVPGCPFPNYHVRTNAFVMLRELFLRWAPIDPTREECLAFEAGPNSLTRRVQESGLKALTIPRKEFRRGEQSRLLVADNRTDDYQNADPERRRFLQRLAWGQAR